MKKYLGVIPKKVNQLEGVKTTNPIVQANKRLRLRVLNDRLPEIPEDKKPPCESCKAAPCCKAFLVELSKSEYESGLYEEYAVEITPEIEKQLHTQGLALTMLGSPVSCGEGVSKYYLEGGIWDACPFLQEDNRCGIYENRPLTCRVYTCVGDKRITQEMRDGDVTGYKL